jgi:alkylation response protein AidB-like acyl-CoA dehydrogenase
MADYTLDDDQQQIQDMMRKFARNELRAVARPCDEQAEPPEDLMAKTWELGLTMNSVPEDFGGFDLGRSAVTSAIIAEELAWGDLSLALAATSPLLMMIPILEFGTDQQKAAWLPKFTGETPFLASAALMEPRIGFSPFDLKTTVTESGQDLVINGSKCLVPLADRAEAMLVYGVSPGSSGPGAVQAVIVEAGTPGLSVGEREKNLGLNALPLFPVSFDNCRIPKDNRLGGDQGLDYLRLLNLSRVVTSAMAVGVARASHEYARDYAKERQAFGEPIAGRQSIAFMLAESAIEVDAMRLLVWKAAWHLDRNEEALRATTLARNYCADQSMKVVDYGVQILGGHGYIREHPVEMWFRNGRAFAVVEGLAIG